jgi:hypothetical protein
MRTTVNIEDKVLEAVKEYAAARSISLSTAVSDLLKRGLPEEIPTIWENGILVFAPRPDTPRITIEQALAIEDMIEDEEDKRIIDQMKSAVPRRRRKAGSSTE